MSKVSYPTSVVVGLAGPKEHPKGVSDGEQVNIPALQCIVITMRGRIWYMGRLIDTLTKHKIGDTFKCVFHYEKVPSPGNESRKADKTNALHILCAEKIRSEEKLQPYRNRTHVDWCEYTKVKNILRRSSESRLRNSAN